MFGVRCPGCDRPGWCPCPDCTSALEPAPATAVPGVDVVSALFAHRDRGRRIVSSFKYGDRRAVGAWLAEGMAGLPAARGGVDLVTWVPASPQRQARTGHDAGRVLARGVARRIRAPAVALLVRGQGSPQTGRLRSERLHGPQLALGWRSRAHRGGQPLAGRRVLLVDDVVTTGASLAAAAALLRVAGARSVVAAAVAVRPYEGRQPVQ